LDVSLDPVPVLSVDRRDLGRVFFFEHVPAMLARRNHRESVDVRAENQLPIEVHE
jgi:hypothetical protein